MNVTGLRLNRPNLIQLLGRLDDYTTLMTDCSTARHQWTGRRCAMVGKRTSRLFSVTGFRLAMASWIAADFVAGVARNFGRMLPRLGAVRQSGHINYYSTQSLRTLLSGGRIAPGRSNYDYVNDQKSGSYMRLHPRLRFGRIVNRSNVFQNIAFVFCVLFGLALIANTERADDGGWFWYSFFFDSGKHLYADMHLALQPLYVLETSAFMAVMGKGWLVSKIPAVLHLVAYCLAFLYWSGGPPFRRAQGDLLACSFFISSPLRRTFSATTMCSPIALCSTR